MNKHLDIQRRIDEALESLQNIQPAAPNPFFFTRLEARLMRNDLNLWERLSSFVTTPSVAFTTMAFVLILNIFVIFNGDSDIQNESIAREMTYNEDLRTTSFYDIENVQP
jgi:hypothetical protein